MTRPISNFIYYANRTRSTEKENGENDVMATNWTVKTIF